MGFSMKKTILKHLLTLLTLSFLFLSCSETTTKKETNCGGVVCQENQECVNNLCVEISDECSVTNPTGKCQSGFVCDLGVCKEEITTECSLNNPTGDCEEGFICKNGVCEEEVILECNGNGTLNNENICICNDGFTGKSCNSWEKRWGSHSESGALRSEFDKSGDFIYTIGYIGNSAQTYSPTLTKFNSNGEKIWEKSWGSNEIYQMPVAITIGENGDIYIAGEVGNETLAVFLTKFTQDGTEGWTKTWQSEYGVFVWDLIVDEEDGLYITGTTFSSMKTGLTLKGESDIFVIKAKDNGSTCSEIWLKQFGGDKMDSGKRLMNKDNKIHLLAEIDGDSSIDENIGAIMFKFGIISFNYSGEDVKQTIFLENLVDAYPSSFEIDSNGNFYIIGEAKSSFDSIENKGDADIFLVKLNSSFAKIWSKLLGTPEYDAANDIEIDSTDNIYIISHTYGSVGDEINKGESDMLLTKWNSEGNLLWSKMSGDDNIESGEAGMNLQFNSNEDLFITGVAESIYQDDGSVKSKAMLKKILKDDNL